MKLMCVTLWCLLASAAAPHISNQEAVELARKYVRLFRPTRAYNDYQVVRTRGTHGYVKVIAGEAGVVVITLSDTGELVGYMDYSLDIKEMDRLPEKHRTDEESWQALDVYLRLVGAPPDLTVRVLERDDQLIDRFSLRPESDGPPVEGEFLVEAWMLKGENRIVGLWISRNQSYDRPRVNGGAHESVTNLAYVVLVLVIVLIVAVLLRLLRGRRHFGA
jgi:hypothetical protein